jgi:hypothetical protein
MRIMMIAGRRREVRDDVSLVVATQRIIVDSITGLAARAGRRHIRRTAKETGKKRNDKANVGDLPDSVDDCVW